MGQSTRSPFFMTAYSSVTLLLIDLDVACGGPAAVPVDRDAAAAGRVQLADPAVPVGFSDAHLILGGEPCAVTVFSLRQYQATRFADATTAGTIVSRYCPLDQAYRHDHRAVSSTGTP